MESPKALFPDAWAVAPHRMKARRELRRVLLELEYEHRHATTLRGNREMAFKAAGAEVRIAALRARAAQLRRSAGLARSA